MQSYFCSLKRLHIHTHILTFYLVDWNVQMVEFLLSFWQKKVKKVFKNSILCFFFLFCGLKKLQILCFFILFCELKKNCKLYFFVYPFIKLLKSIFSLKKWFHSNSFFMSTNIWIKWMISWLNRAGFGGPRCGKHCSSQGSSYSVANEKYNDVDLCPVLCDFDLGKRFYWNFIWWHDKYLIEIKTNYYMLRRKEL